MCLQRGDLDAELFSQSLLILVVYSSLYLLTYLKGKKGPPSLFTGEKLKRRTLSRNSSPSLGKHTQGSVHQCRQGFHHCMQRSWVSLSTVAVSPLSPNCQVMGERKGAKKEGKRGQSTPLGCLPLQGQRTKVPEEQGSDVRRLC